MSTTKKEELKNILLSIGEADFADCSGWFSYQFYLTLLKIISLNAIDFLIDHLGLVGINDIAFLSPSNDVDVLKKAQIEETINIDFIYLRILVELFRQKTHNIDKDGCDIILNESHYSNNQLDISNVIDVLEGLVNGNHQIDVNTLSDIFPFVKEEKKTTIVQERIQNNYYEDVRDSPEFPKKVLGNNSDDFDFNDFLPEDEENGEENDLPDLESKEADLQEETEDQRRKREREERANAALRRMMSQTQKT